MVGETWSWTSQVRLNLWILRSKYYWGQPSDLVAFSAGCIIVHLPTCLVFKANALTGSVAVDLLSHPHDDDPSLLFNAQKHIIFFR